MRKENSNQNKLYLRTFAFCGKEMEENGDRRQIFIQMGDISPCFQVDRHDPTIDIKGIFLFSFIVQ
jgi:hypothetical protein